MLKFSLSSVSIFSLWFFLSFTKHFQRGVIAPKSDTSQGRINNASDYYRFHTKASCAHSDGHSLIHCIFTSLIDHHSLRHCISISSIDCHSLRHCIFISSTDRHSLRHCISISSIDCHSLRHCIFISSTDRHSLRHCVFISSTDRHNRYI